MAGVSPQRIVISLSAIVSVVVLLAVVYLFSDGLSAVYVERRHLTETLAPSGASSIFPQDTTAYREFSTVAQEEDGEVLEEGEDDKTEENKVDEIEDNKEEGIIEEITPVGITDKDSDFSTKEQSSVMFSIRKGFNFPHPQVFQPTQKILNANWVHQLKDYLHSIHPARSLTITVATKSFIPNLLNWLIAAYRLAEPPMDNVLILAFDKAVFSLLSARKIPCVYVPYSSVLKKLKKGVSTVWMTRLAVIRLLNHWGYNVLQLDTDAVPLKNPHLLFDGYSDYDLVGARGVLPFELGHGPWGFTLCMGAALLRGTQRMETLWEVMHSGKMEKTTDDQKRVNFALFKSKLQWESKEQQFSHASVATNRDGVRVAVLPRKYICRKTCSLDTSSETDVIIWHQSGGGHSASWKSKQNLKSTVWFLRPDYDTRPVDSSVTGLQWLEQLTLPGSLDNVRRRLSPARQIKPMIS